jgi:hypothetical protein
VVGLAVNFGMTDTDPAKTGGGSVIAFNTVLEGVFARAIWLSGVRNISVHDNYSQRTSSLRVSKARALQTCPFRQAASHSR